MLHNTSHSHDVRSRLNHEKAWALNGGQCVDDALIAAVNKAYAEGPCHPRPEDWFRALKLVGSPKKVRVVILGQDPYHGPSQANGLAFSVNQGVALPPSLRNIFKELSRDGLGVPPVHGDLSAWAAQGVLLLNDVLSVGQGQAASHSRFGWQAVTRAILEQLTHRPVVFLLWGRHARMRAAELQSLHPEHQILQAPHPSPLSAHRGFLGCGHFSKVNQWLSSRGESEIQWLTGPW